MDETPHHSTDPLVADLRTRLSDNPPDGSPTDRDASTPTIAVALLQRRGVLSVPMALREALHWAEGQRVLMTAADAGTLTVQAALAPEAFFARYDPQVSVPDTLPRSETVPRRWLDVDTLRRAQAWPDSPQRAWFIRCDGGFVSARLDPSLLPEALDGLGQLLPDLDRPARAHYVQTVLSWTGITLADRTFYFGALHLWGADETLTWAQAVQRGRDAE